MQQLDFKKYNRLFTFGCSFTSYMWPTWTDVIRTEMSDDIEYYNFGHPGSGNIMISSRLVEANKRYNFCDTDLVIVLWSTFCREDRWANGHWIARGNIYNQDIYTDAWVKTYADPLGYLIRDLPLITVTNSYLIGLPCDNLILRSVPMTHTEMDIDSANQHHLNDLYRLYQDYDDLPISMFDVLNGWQRNLKFLDEEHNVELIDSHPWPIDYYVFLKTIGVNLTDKSLQFASDMTAKLKLATTKSDILRAFDDVIIGLGNTLF